MRVAVVTESFLPQVNGVTNSVLRVLEHLRLRGHTALVVAPGVGLSEYAGAPVVRVPSIALPGYRDFPVGVPGTRLEPVLRDFTPDVVHLASPIALGYHGAVVARRLDVPAVSVYQTDVAGYCARYGWPGAPPLIWWWLRRLHAMTARTLAPSSHAARNLRLHGIEDVALWRRGVDSELFSPAHRSAAVRAELAPAGELLVGTVGRLAVEKRLDALTEVAALPGVRLVLVGDGPERHRLAQALPDAAILGWCSGRRLSQVVASLDVLAHPGVNETFCQAVQEALAAGVPVVAPAAGGLTDLVQPGRTGLLCPTGSAAELSALVVELRDDPPRRLAMAAAARRSVAHRGWAAIGDELLGHYRHVTGERRTRVAA